jgi:hypothetical protein
MSALDTFWAMNGIDRSAERSLSLQLRLYQAPGMKPLLARIGAKAPDRAQLPLIHRIHQAIQGDRVAITDGMMPVPAQWLGTNYEGSEEDRLERANQMHERLKGELLKLGLDIPDGW